MVSKRWLRAAGFAALAASAVVRNVAPPRKGPQAALHDHKVVALDAYRKAPTDQSWQSLLPDLLARVDED